MFKSFRKCSNAFLKMHPQKMVKTKNKISDELVELNTQSIGSGGKGLGVGSEVVDGGTLLVEHASVGPWESHKGGAIVWLSLPQL